jgi:hypothetical protein
MKTKKLTKREWYLGAQMYHSYISDGWERFDLGFMLHVALCREITEHIEQCERFPIPDRWAMASQLCLERAGIPAGKP